MLNKSKKIEGKKFMWDGYTYKKEDEAKNAEENYKKDGFETKITVEDDHYLLYTRRVATEIAVEREVIQ